MATQTSVRVLARFRPINNREREEEAKSGPTKGFSLSFPDKQSCKISDASLGSYTFPLDRVFPPDTLQTTVYEDCGRPTIEFEILYLFNPSLPFSLEIYFKDIMEQSLPMVKQVPERFFFSFFLLSFLSIITINNSFHN